MIYSFRIVLHCTYLTVRKNLTFKTKLIYDYIISMLRLNSLEVKLTNLGFSYVSFWQVPQTRFLLQLVREY